MTDVLQLLDDIKIDVPIIYYVTYCGFFLITLNYLIKVGIKFKDTSISDLVSSLSVIIGIILFATKEPLIFLLSIIIIIISQTPRIIKFISDNSHVELNKYKEHYTRIIDQDSYTLLEILVIYNLISMEDYVFLFTKHADKTEEEMIKILEERVILDVDKKQTALVLFNQYKLNKKLISRDDSIIEEIENQLYNRESG